jgi:hypothetical protein
MSEAKYEVSQVQRTLFIGLFNVQSAFDAVQYIIVMDKLFDQKIPLALLSIIIHYHVQWPNNKSEVERRIK